MNQLSNTNFFANLTWESRWSHQEAGICLDLNSTMSLMFLTKTTQLNGQSSVWKPFLRKLNFPKILTLKEAKSISLIKALKKWNFDLTFSIELESVVTDTPFLNVVKQIVLSCISAVYDHGGFNSLEEVALSKGPSLVISLLKWLDPFWTLHSISPRVI